ncbi:MAG: HlyD family efflux transporter periplasmic adaptor subunit [Planctomycetaceae bacterium TMED241]|jgi:hemolysin D|uniref:HlyD family secretion protein n=1 Tax=Parasynechococcus sp. TaxID=3101203 RepID=UPI000B6D80E2|nr:MAG: HlyD family efflux transporter periplasmic adaptor subunit [Synechococcus sp. MED-G70]RPG10462.1 MAG: HlyD family efflux transporter periplasmic adaptor subunit [Planctomycetaceae bacterium TMED241]|tara:strand:+ start:5307 stop:6590 length:1284 start_codon:yes stop_codon:yes gene_type:complete
MKLNPFKRDDSTGLAQPTNGVQDVNGETVSITRFDESVLQQGRFWMRTVTWTLIGTTVFGVAWLALARTEEIVVATGKLEPIGSVKDIQMPVGGVADEILVKEGEQVKAGQVLMKLDTEASEEQQRSLQTQMQALQNNLQLKDDELSLKRKELRDYLAMNREEVAMLEKNLVLASDILGRLEELARQGATPELQLLQQRNTVEETRGRLMQTRVDRDRQSAILNQNITQLQQAIQQTRSQEADLKAKLAETRVTLRYQQLKSPVDGVVFDLKPTSTGFTAQSTQTVMKVVPYGSLEAKVEVPSNKIGFVKLPQGQEGKPGCPQDLSICMDADISIDSYPSTDFGVLNGKVTKIGSDALPPDPQEQREQLSFPVTVELQQQQLKLKSGTSLPLQVGMSLTANIKLRKVSYLQLLLGEFQDKAESLQRL